MTRSGRQVGLNTGGAREAAHVAVDFVAAGLALFSQPGHCNAERFEGGDVVLKPRTKRIRRRRFLESVRELVFAGTN